MRNNRNTKRYGLSPMKYFSFIILILCLGHSIHAQIHSATTSKPDTLIKIWQGTGISSNRISGIKHSNDTIQTLPKNALGYPIGQNRVEHYFYWGSNGNRYLVKYKNKYCITDSNLNIIIPLSDTIYSTLIYDTINYSLTVSDGYFEYTYSCLYQAVKGKETTLLDNNGNVLTNKPFEGIVMEDDLVHYHDLLVLRTYSIDSLFRIKKGLIDSDGHCLIPNTYNHIQTTNYYGLKNIYCILINYADSNNIIKESYSFYLINSQSITFETSNIYYEFEEYDLFIFEDNGHYGIFHPTLGVLIKPKYVKIDLSHTNHDFLDNIILIDKKGEKSTWNIPNNLTSLYPKLKEQ